MSCRYSDGYSLEERSAGFSIWSEIPCDFRRFSCRETLIFANISVNIRGKKIKIMLNAAQVTLVWSFYLRVYINPEVTMRKRLSPSIAVLALKRCHCEHPDAAAIPHFAACSLVVIVIVNVTYLERTIAEKNIDFFMPWPPHKLQKDCIVIHCSLWWVPIFRRVHLSTKHKVPIRWTGLGLLSIFALTLEIRVVLLSQP